MKRFRIVSNAVITLACMFAFIGCKKEGSSGAGSAASAKQVTAIFMSGIYADSARELAAEYEAQTGVKVKIVDAPYLNLHEKEVTDLMTGAGAYDILQVASQWDGEVLPTLLPIDDRIAKDDPGAADFIPAVWEAAGKWEGRTYGLPAACDAITLFYRSDLFAERSKDFEAKYGKALEAPKTWEEYLQIAEFFDGAGAGTLRGNTIMGLREQDFTLWSGIFWGMGGKLVDDQWHPTLADETGVKSLDVFIRMFKYAPAGSNAAGIPEANAQFLQGNGAMYMTWPSLISAKFNDPAGAKVTGKVAAATLPGNAPQLSAWSLGISTTCKSPDAAYGFIKFYTNAENTKRLFQKYGKGSPRISTYTDPELTKRVFYLPQVLEGLNHARPRFRIAASQEMCDFLDLKISSALIGEIKPKQALEETVKKWDEIRKAAAPRVPK